MICRRCGSEVSEEANFCPNCGYKSFYDPDELEKPEEDNTVKNSSKAVTVVLALLCICLLGFAAYEIIQVRKGNTEISRLSDSLNEYNSSIKQKDEEISLKNAALKDLENEISKLEEANKKLVTENIDLQKGNRDLNQEIEEMRRNSDELWDENYDLSIENNFYETYACIVLDDGTKQYHVYSCPLIGEEEFSFWIYNVNAAENMGYYACPKCH